MRTARTALLLLMLRTTVVLPCDSSNCTTTRDRQRAFEAVYDEYRWMRGGDGAKCRSGWSDVHNGQAAAAQRALLRVVRDYAVTSLVDLPIGDLCFSSATIAALGASYAPACVFCGVTLP